MAVCANSKLGARALDEYIERYRQMERSFEETVESFGLPFAAGDEPSSPRNAVLSLSARGASVENDGKSVWVNWISPACLACRMGVRTETFLSSVQCPRKCWFCFNENQQGYESFHRAENDIVGLLRKRIAAGASLDHLAVTGGEPLLHQALVLGFLETARIAYPASHLRLYTSGYGLDAACARALAEAGLDEIRISVKLGEGTEAVREALSALSACIGLVPSVMVEMPVMPDQIDAMKDLLVTLDHMGIAGINLLELCFPFHNAIEFARRGYFVKRRPYRVVYDYWYAGGLPIAGSEAACLDLVRFALNEELAMGVHYCSLENKLTGQVYKQNAAAFSAGAFPLSVMDERDFFLKSAKVFGGAIVPVRDALSVAGHGADCKLNEEFGFLEFPLSCVSDLGPLTDEVAIGVSVAIAERDCRGFALRELKVESLA